MNLFRQHLEQIKGLQPQVFPVIPYLLAQTIVDHHNQPIINPAISHKALPEGLVSSLLFDPSRIGLPHCYQRFDRSLSHSYLFIVHQSH